MQGERRTKRKRSFQLFLPSRRLTWAQPKYARRAENNECAMERWRGAFHVCVECFRMFSADLLAKLAGLASFLAVLANFLARPASFSETLYGKMVDPVEYDEIRKDATRGALCENAEARLEVSEGACANAFRERKSDDIHIIIYRCMRSASVA